MSMMKLVTSGRAWVAVWALSACTFDTSTTATSSIDGDAALDNAATDAALSDGPPCVGAQVGFPILNMDDCDPLPPAGSLMLDAPGNYTLNTDSGLLTDPSLNETMLDFTVVPQTNGPDLFVTTATDVQVGSETTVLMRGQRPFVLVSTGGMTIAGNLYATGREERSGPGGNWDVSCLGTGRGQDGVLQNDENGNSGGGGGGGGGFGDDGGDGAKIDEENEGGLETAGGLASVNTELVPLRGGCAGGAGGNIGGGLAGGGGGAIQLVAADTITLNGRISTSGGGGVRVTASESGGAGGGSGGGVLIQANTLTDRGIITVNGGGGGEGSRGGSNSDSGNNGYRTVEGPAPGGNGVSFGGNGGVGGTVDSSAGNGTEGFNNNGNAAGGGGGGGAGGRVVINTEN